MRDAFDGASHRRSVAAQNKTIIMPLFAQMGEADLTFVTDTLADVLRTA